MQASFEDARLLFGRWRDEAPPLRVKLSCQSLVFEATGTVADFTSSTLQLHGPAWRFLIPLGNARFVFSDPREIPVPAVRAAETAKYEFGLAIELPSGDRLVLLEIKAAPQEPGGED
jgi:hypothetical protein